MSMLRPVPSQSINVNGHIYVTVTHADEVTYLDANTGIASGIWELHKEKLALLTCSAE